MTRNQKDRLATVANRRGAGQKAQKRRANGTGSTWWDERRQRYVGQISVRDAAGNLKRRTVFARTQADLDTRLDELKRSTEVSPDLPVSPTVAQFMTYWLENVLPIEGLKPKTTNGYADYVRLYIDPTIGRILVTELEPAHVRKMLATLVDRGYSPNTQRLARSTLRRALNTAVADGLVPRNVATAVFVKGAKIGKTRKGTLTPDEARRLLEAADAAGEGALVAIMLGLGLRRGEALGLRWTDIRLDADRPTLSVSGALAVDGRGGVEWGEAKAGSERTLHLPADLVERLRRHRAGQLEGELAQGRGRRMFVFTNGAGNHRDPDKVTRLVRQIAVDAGLGNWTPHGLRHSAASILIAAGVPLKEISETLGHASIRMTADTYGHLLEPARIAVAEAMQAAIFS